MHNYVCIQNESYISPREYHEYSKQVDKNCEKDMASTTVLLPC